MAGRARRLIRISPVQLVTAAVVLGVFIAAVVIGGIVGSLVLGVVAVTAGALLLARWRDLDPRIRVLRLVAVLGALAVAVSLAFRN